MPDLPPRLNATVDLEEPDNPAEAKPSDTAPLSEFVAAGCVLLGMVMVVGGAILRRPVVMLVGFLLMLVVTGTFAIFGRNSSLRRAAASSVYWVFSLF